MMPVNIPEFVPPEFLQGHDVETIHRRMLNRVPANWDKSEGQFMWDATRPVAMEKAELVDQVIYRTLQLMYPQFATGVYLDWHGQARGVYRLPATKATGVVTFTGEAGTLIPLGTAVSTVATDTSPAIQFVTTQEAVIDETGTVDVPIEAIEVGMVGNIPAGAIRVLATPVSGVSAVVNNEPTTGGTNEEDDEAYRYRILERDQNKSLSGAARDYERWAMEVPGVGSAKCLPEWNGPGTVGLLIIDANGEPANQQIIDAVQAHIAPNGRDGSGLAPIGALVTVMAPRVRQIDVSVELTLEPGHDLLVVTEEIKKALKQYFVAIGMAEVVRYNEIGAIIINVPGVQDYTNLLVAGGTVNVKLADDEMAALGTVMVT